MGVQICDPSGEEVETGRSLGSLASQDSLLMELWNNRHCHGRPMSRHRC